jgi:uncharacterized protein
VGKVLSVPYWRARDRYYRILGNKCEKCGKEYFPPVAICRECRSAKFIDCEMPKTGSLVSYTQQKESVQGFEDQEPMVFGLLELANGVKMIAQIVDLPYDSLKEGIKLKAVFRRIKVDGDSGQIFYGYKFGPDRDADTE